MSATVVLVLEARVRSRTLVAVLGGFVAAFVSGYALCALAIHPALQPDGGSASYGLGAVPFSYLLLFAGEAEALVAVLGGYFLGGAVAGGISRTAPGTVGLASAALVAPFATAWLLTAVPPFLYVRTTLGVASLSPGVAGIAAFWAVVCGVFVALCLGAAFLGGRLARRGRPPTRSLRSDETRAGEVGA